MILVIDSSSSGFAMVGTIDGERFTEVLVERGPEALTREVSGFVRGGKLTRVAVATGPGSFTGLRVGVSVGLGIAMGLRIPIVPLPSLQLQAARSDEPVTAVGDAGRGRFYYMTPGAQPSLGDPIDIPSTYPLVGGAGGHASSLIAAGHRFKPEPELRREVEAAAILLETAPEVAYGRLEIQYMQSFSVPTKSEPSA